LLDLNKTNLAVLCIALALHTAFPANAQAEGDAPTLNAPSLYTLGPTDGNRSVAIADFDADGYDDLAVGSDGSTVSILLNDGTGALGAPRTYATTTTSPVLAAGDFDGDNNLDIVAVRFANYGSTTMELLLGDGTGAFRPGLSFDVCNTLAIVAVDYEGDGKLDVALGGTCGVTLLHGNGNGGFAPAISYHSALVLSLETADVNVDGRPDLLGLTAGGGVEVWLNDGAGGLRDSMRVQTGLARGFDVGDLNGDGAPDLVFAYERFSVETMLGDGAGGFTTSTTLQVALSPDRVRVADFNRDGRLDVATVTWQEKGKFQILFGDGSGGLEAGTAALLTVTCAYDLEVGNFDGDEVPDFAFADGCRPEAGLLLGRNITATFDVCIQSAETGERFKAVTRVAQTDPAYGYFEYHMSPVGFASGHANVVKRTARQVRLKLTNSTVFSLNAKFNLRTGASSVTVKNLTRNSKSVIKTHDYSDGGCN
jgi:hypothetical protein